MPSHITIETIGVNAKCADCKMVDALFYLRVNYTALVSRAKSQHYYLCLEHTLSRVASLVWTL